jgi:type IV pilus assembly protein PilF
MFKRWITLLVLSLVGGCVTVETEDGSSKFNPHKAADARIELGMNYLTLGHNVRAKQNLEIALQYTPNYVHASSAIAYYYQQVFEPELADKWYRKALTESPNNGDVLNNYGVFLCRQQEYEQAQLQFEQAIHQFGYLQVSSSYENAGLCAAMQGNLQQAKTYFYKSLEYEPSRFRSHIELVKISVHFEAYSEALQRLQNIYRLFGKKTEAQQLELQIASLLER